MGPGHLVSQQGNIEFQKLCWMFCCFSPLIRKHLFVLRPRTCMNLAAINSAKKKYDVTKLWNFEVILIACNSLALSLSLSLSILCFSSRVLWVLDFSPLHTPSPFNLSFLRFLSWTLHPLSLLSIFFFSPLSPLPNLYPPTSNLPPILARLLSYIFLLWFYTPLLPFALISHPLPTTPGWDSGKYPTDLNHTLPGGSRGRPCRKTEAIILSSASTVRVVKTDCVENNPGKLVSFTHKSRYVFTVMDSFTSLQLGGLGEVHEEKVESSDSINCCQSACSYQ